MRIALLCLATMLVACSNPPPSFRCEATGVAYVVTTNGDHTDVEPTAHTWVLTPARDVFALEDGPTYETTGTATARTAEWSLAVYPLSEITLRADGSIDVLIAVAGDAAQGVTRLEQVETGTCVELGR